MSGARAVGIALGKRSGPCGVLDRSRSLVSFDGGQFVKVDPCHAGVYHVHNKGARWRIPQSHMQRVAMAKLGK